MGLAESLRAVADSFGGFQDEYDEYDYEDCADDDVRAETREPERGGSHGRRSRGEGAGYDEIYREEPYRRSRHGGGRPAGDQPARPLALVRPPRTEFALVAPQDFEAAQRVADLLKGGSPVVVDLQLCDRELRKRLIDFCSGLIYAVDARLQFVGETTVLLAPDNVDPSTDEPGALQERAFFNQA